MGGGGVPGVSAAPARNPSKISGHAKGIKGNVSHTLGRVTGSTTLQLKGHQDKMAGRAEVQAAKAHKFSQAAGQHQNAAAAQAYGGPMSNPAAGVKQNLAHMKMNHNAY
ncbi:hypothetical protein BJ085DRAFT_17566 [Dimargaris cristalligena]|uniref:CsbD-like domain-containing protein n=1 Tax=Dimargaris cristalligena TaxID=215637 RepID=A0A4P9ZQK3_9FUNG|nr:hypothetical protein BJ085DRAFT_17566 [Dimargaris cristalligena]|eukprot:RKP34690.1 hypothetical protein BJ085DRAFT_17566 [Dimargaris cristalligena]